MSTPFNHFDLTGRSALITGGATGLGYYMARGLMRAGAGVMLAARREDVLKEAVDRLRAESSAGEAHYCCVDLSDRESVRSLAEHAARTMNGIDIFVGNAGQDIFEPVDQISDGAIDSMFQVNVSANIELVRALLPAMQQKKWGRIIFSGSITTRVVPATDSMSMYITTKAAIDGFTRAVAAEAGHEGVTVNNLLLGPFVTEMLEATLAKMETAYGKQAAETFFNDIAGNSALGRWGRADEVEGLVQFVASDAAAYLTGSSLVFDGGSSIMLRPRTPPQEAIYPPKP